jgi:uncharacterized protein
VTLLAVPLLAGAAYAAIFVVANRLVFEPIPYPQGRWDLQAELGARDVWLDSAGRLHAWWIPVPDTPVVTLYLHGNGGNVACRPGHLQEISAAGSSVLIPDYRGYGRSPGRPSERGLYQDAEAAYEYLIGQGYQPGQIVLLGESLGSAVAVDLASRRECAALILECPFTSAAQMAGTVVPWLGPLFVRGFNSRRKIAAVRAPLLIIHGDADHVVPQAMGRELFEAANPPKSFWTIPGARHKTIVQTAGPLYRARLQQFYESLGLGRTSSKTPDRGQPGLSGR